MASQDTGITFTQYETVPFALRASSMLGKLVSTIGKWGTLFLILFWNLEFEIFS